MLLALAEAAAGLLALTVLLLLPGLLIVRSPWPFVPFLSLSFWLITWGWLAPAGPGRERFLHVTLAFSALLAGLRLLKPLEASRPSWPTGAVIVAALARLAPYSTWPAAPGLEAGFASASALLLTWRDGIPASYLPLYSLFGFGAGDFGLPALAADVSFLAGLAPHRALLLATLASEGLLALAVFAFARRYVPAAPAALCSVVAPALALLGVARSEGDAGAPLALALAIAGAALVLRGAGRSTVVAAGLFWAGALVSLGISGAVVVGVVTAGLVAAGVWPALGRLGLAGAVAAFLAAPALWRTADSLDFTRPRLLLLPLALAAAAGLVVAAGRGPRWAGRPWAQPAVVALVLAATLGDWTMRTARIRVHADDLAAAAWLRAHSHPTDVVCADDEASRAWVPALAGRAVRPGRLPGSRIQPFDGATCRFQVLRGAAAPALAIAPAFNHGSVALVTLR